MAKRTQIQTAVVCSDIHAGFENPAALNILYDIIEEVQPNIVIVNGDLVDAYSISRFLKDPTRILSLQDEIQTAQDILSRIQRVSPKATHYLTEGNHEARLQKLIAGLDGPARELAKLPVFRSTISWESLLNLASTGWTWIGEKQQPKAGLIPHMVVKHGSVIRKYSAYTAKGEFDTYHYSGTSGHTHRLGHFYQTSIGGVQQWVETGCLCQLNPEYMTHPNWQSGFAVFSWAAHSKNIPNVELVHIQHGQAVFRGEQYGRTTQ